MADLPHIPSDAASTGSAADQDSHPGMPRWVKAAVAVVLVLVVALVIGKLAGVDHGPGRHGGDGQTPASQVGESGRTPAGAGGHTPPPGLDHGQP